MDQGEPFFSLKQFLCFQLLNKLCILNLLDISSAVKGDLPENGVPSEANSCYESQEQDWTHSDAYVSVGLEVTVNELGRENQGQQATHHE